MTRFSTRDAAKKLGLSPSGLSKHIRLGKLPAPTIIKTGRFSVHVWTEQDIENARQLLPKIANGRKTRHKKQSAVSNQQSAKPKTKKKSAQPRAAVLHKQSKPPRNRPAG
jgi:hypothetical protein